MAKAMPMGRGATHGPWEAVAQLKWIWSLAALVPLLLYNALFTPNFFALTLQDGNVNGYVIDVVNRAAPVMLVALGMTLVIATKGVDLSVGAVVAVVGAVAAQLVTKTALPFGTVLLVALGVSLVLGLWNGVLVSVFDVQPMVATLILMVSGRGVAQLVTGGQIINFDNPPLVFMGSGHLFGVPFTFTVVAVAFVVVAALTRLTAMGLFIEAVGDNETASRYAGIRVRAVKLFVYVLCGVCAAAAGLIVAGDVKSADANNAGLNFELDAILAVVIGGTSMLGGRFYLIGSVLGALIIQTLTTTLLAHGIPTDRTLVAKAIAVLVVCLLQSPQFRAKLFGRRAS